MANYINSPWVSGTNDLGEVFSNLLMNMARIRAGQDLAGQNQALQREEMAQRQPLLQAQTGAQNAAAGYDIARTGDIAKGQNIAQDAGLAAFANVMSRVPGYQQGQTSLLPNTPDIQQMLAKAMLSQHLTQSAAGAPSAAASLLRPMELNQDAQMREAITGALMAEGQRSPEKLYNVGPEEALVSALGKTIFTNPNQRSSGVAPQTDARYQADSMRQLLQFLTGNVTDEMGEPTGKQVYQGMPGGGQTFSNAVNILNRGVQQMAGTNAPVAVAPQATGTNEVQRVTKDGRTAIFDANTKQFIRYAP